MKSTWEVLAESLHFPDEKTMWRTLYLDRKMSVSVLAAKFACSQQTVRLRLSKADVQMRSRGGRNRLKFEVTDELIAAIERDGVIAVAKAMNLTPQALYKRVYYARGIKLRAQAAEAAPREEGQPSSTDLPTTGPQPQEGDRTPPKATEG